MCVSPPHVREVRIWNVCEPPHEESDHRECTYENLPPPRVREVIKQNVYESVSLVSSLPREVII